MHIFPVQNGHKVADAFGWAVVIVLAAVVFTGFVGGIALVAVSAP